MHARGELDGDPADLALALLTALQGGLLMTQVTRTVRPLEVALDAMLALVESRLRGSGRYRRVASSGRRREIAPYSWSVLCPSS